jgi:hypothetical protein
MTGVSSTINPLVLHAGRGMGTYIHYSDAPDTTLGKHKILEYAKYLDLSNAEDILSRVIPVEFQEQVETHDMTLVEAMAAAKGLIEVQRSQPVPVETAGRLASILSLLAPNETPAELAERLRSLMDQHLDEAVQLLDGHLARNNRNSDGFILLRGKAVR